jgi:hypothetical protein
VLGVPVVGGRDADGDALDGGVAGEVAGPDALGVAATAVAGAAPGWPGVAEPQAAISDDAAAAPMSQAIRRTGAAVLVAILRRTASGCGCGRLSRLRTLRALLTPHAGSWAQATSCEYESVCGAHRCGTVKLRYVLDQAGREQDTAPPG